MLPDDVADARKTLEMYGSIAWEGYTNGFRCILHCGLTGKGRYSFWGNAATKKMALHDLYTDVYNSVLHEIGYIENE